MAAARGVSYPMVRLCLYRFMAHIQVYDSQQTISDFERVARVVR